MGLMDIRRRILADAPVLAEASGAVASFSTDMAVPLKKCQFSIVPVQSGMGDPSPSNVRPISGWTGVAGQRTGKNLFDEEYSNISSEIQYKPIFVGNGTFTLSTNYTVEVAGVANVFLLAGNVSSGASSTSNGVWDGQNRTVTSIGGYVTIAYRCYQGTTTPANYNTQLEIGSTATAYTPYTGEQIAVTFPVQGKNLIPQSIVNDSHYFPLTLPVGTQLVFSGIPIGNYGVLRTYDSNKTFKESKVLSATEGSRSYNAFALSYDISYVRVEFSGTSFTDVQLEKGTAMTAYEPYTNTVYGGTLDVVSGVLTVDRKMADLSTLTWGDPNSSGRFDSAYIDEMARPSGEVSIISDVYVGRPNIAGSTINSNYVNGDIAANTSSGRPYICVKDSRFTTGADLKASLVGHQISYTLKTPITYQLTPQQITALKGQINNVWCDTGNTTVKYWKH